MSTLRYKLITIILISYSSILWSMERERKRGDIGHRSFAQEFIAGLERRGEGLTCDEFSSMFRELWQLRGVRTLTSIGVAMLVASRLNPLCLLEIDPLCHSDTGMSMVSYLSIASWPFLAKLMDAGFKKNDHNLFAAACCWVMAGWGTETATTSMNMARVDQIAQELEENGQLKMAGRLQAITEKYLIK